MSYTDEQDAAVLAEFWDYLTRAGRLPKYDDHDKQAQIVAFLDARRERRQAEYGR